MELHVACTLCGSMTSQGGYKEGDSLPPNLLSFVKHNPGCPTQVSFVPIKSDDENVTRIHIIQKDRP